MIHPYGVDNYLGLSTLFNDVTPTYHPATGAGAGAIAAAPAVSFLDIYMFQFSYLLVHVATV